MRNVLVIKELHFDASHYLNSDFGKCQNDHGHRWYIRNLKVVTTKIVDFNKIKKVVDFFDHCKIIPEEHYEFWLEVTALAKEHKMPFKISVYTIPAKLTLVENIKEALKKQLLDIDGVGDVSFELYETDNYGVKCDE